MRFQPFRSTTAACALALALAAANVSRAQAPATAPATGPVAVVALTSYEKLMADVDWLGSLMNMPGASQMVDGMLAQMTGGQGLAGLDKTKPIGVVVSMPGPMPMPVVSAYLPVTDQAALLGVLQPLGITSQDIGNGVLQVNAMGTDVYAKNAGGYMLVGMTPDVVGTMPADPTAQIGPLTQQYDVAVQFNVQNLPEAMREQALRGITVNAQGVKMPNESDSDFAARQQAMQSQVENATMMVRELDQVRLGLSIVGEEQRVYLDVNVLAQPGTKLAQELTQNTEATTNFAGFVSPDAALSLTTASRVSGVQAANLEQMVAQVRAKTSQSIDAEVQDAALRDAIRGSVGELFDAVVETVKAGKVDGGAVVFAAPDAVSGVAGGLILEPAKIETALKNLSESLAKAGDSQLPQISWNADKHGDIAFHTLAVPVKKAEARQLLGEQMDVVVGLGGQSAYVAWGKNAAATLKQVIDANDAAPNQATKPMQLTVTLGKVFDALKAVADPGAKPTLEMVSSMLASAGGKDHAIITAQTIDNGMQYRIEVEQGVIQAIATAAMMQSMGGGQSAPVGSGQ